MERLHDMNTVLFDMDGTLLDTLDDLTASVNFALGRAGLPLVTRAQTAQAAGYASVVLMDRLSGHAFSTESAEFKRMWTDFLEHYNAHHSDNTKPYAGIMELLEQLAQRGYRMGVVSNKIHRDTDELREQWFGDSIKLAIGVTDALPKKPAPDMVFAALEALGAQASEAVYVGDSEPDVQIAKNAGCTGVAVTWGFRTREVLEEQGPDYIIDAPQELLDVLDALEQERGGR